MGRRVALAAAGLATAAAPLLLGQEVAGAAATEAHDEQALTFVTSTDETITCTVSVDAFHNTDNANQPTLAFVTGISEPEACFESLTTVLTASYKDSEGVTRTVNYEAGGTTGGTITGAYTATSVRAAVHFNNCDPNESASCDVTVTASPK
jgi:hypothetical protein